MAGKPLWDKNSEPFPILRRPKRTPDEIIQEWSTKRSEPTSTDLPETISNTQGDRSSLEDLLARTTLKVDAPEWYPSNCRNTRDISIGSGDNRELQEPTNEDSPDILRLKQIINTLTKNPGQFDNLVELFMETILPYFEDTVALSIVAKLLVQQAISNPNFRYTGARLCAYVERNCPEYRAELHSICKQQLEEDCNKQNVLMFFAELFIQLPHLTIYGALITDCFRQLFAKGGNDNVKCICQALKLTGYSLERSNKTELDEVIAQLETVKGSVNGSVINLLNSVINLRASNWGYSNETSANTEQPQETFYYEDTPSTTFFSNDGDTFTTEEQEFLTAHLDSNIEYFSDSSDPDDLCDPEPEMDEEIQAAFKEFVQLSKH